MPNLKWYVIFSDQPDAEVLVEEPGDILGRFDIAGQFGHIANRKINGMWIVRHGDEGDDVLRTHGLVPGAISGRFYAAKRQRER